MDYRLVRSKRRTLAITVDSDANCVVRAPMKMPRREIESFIEEKTLWILAKQREMLLKTNKALRSHPVADDGAEWELAGRRFTVRHVNNVPQDYVELTDTEILCSPDINWATLVKFLKATARNYFTQRVNALAPLVGVKPQAVRVSEAQARWGSCSAHNVLNFAWRLIFAHSALIDYVVVHELCHIGCMKHSTAFWQRVAAVMPDYAARRKALKDCGYMLKWFRFDDN